MAHEETREPVSVCPSCSNTKEFYEAGLALALAKRSRDGIYSL